MNKCPGKSPGGLCLKFLREIHWKFVKPGLWTPCAMTDLIYVARNFTSNIDQFSKFFDGPTLHEMCNEVIVIYPTSPQIRRYTTL